MKEYRDAERERVRLSREAKKSDSLYVPAEPKLAFVVRIKGINKIDPKKRKTLQLIARNSDANRLTFFYANQVTGFDSVARTRLGLLGLTRRGPHGFHPMEGSFLSKEG